MKKPSIRVNALFKIMLNTLNIIIPLIVSPYIISRLSRNSYDYYTNASTQMQLFLLFGSFGIFTYGIREISKIKDNKEEVKKLYSTLFSISAVTNIIFLVIYYIFASFYVKSKNELTLYIILGIQLIGNVFNLEWINEAFENYKFITIKTVVSRLLYVVLVFLLIKKNNDVILYAFLISITYALNNLFTFIYVFIKLKFTFKQNNIKKHLKSLLMIFLISNISILYMQADKIMLSLLSSKASLTQYNLANYIIMSLYNLVISFVVVSIPRLTSFIHEKNIIEYENLFNKLVQVFLLFMFPITIGIITVSKDLIIVYGSGKYNDCIIPLALFSVTILISSFSYLQGEATLYISNREKHLIKFNLIGGTLNIIFNVILYFLNIFTSINVIITLMISYLIVIILERNYIIKTLKYKQSFINKKTLKYFLFSLSFIPIHMLIELLLLNELFTLILSVLICTIVYFILLFITKEEEVLNILKICKRISGKCFRLFKKEKKA